MRAEWCSVLWVQEHVISGFYYCWITGEFFMWNFWFGLIWFVILLIFYLWVFVRVFWDIIFWFGGIYWERTWSRVGRKVSRILGELEEGEKNTIKIYCIKLYDKFWMIKLYSIRRAFVHWLQHCKKKSQFIAKRSQIKIEDAGLERQSVGILS